MKVWTSHDFHGHYVGAALVVCAETLEAAIALAEASCRFHGLTFDGMLEELDLTEPCCKMLQDGDY